MSRRVHRILEMIKDKSRSNVHDLENNPQSNYPTLEEQDDPLNESFGTDSIPDSQNSVSLLDDSLWNDKRFIRKPNVVSESDYNSDASESTSSTSSNLDFSSDDSVKDPDYQIRQDLALSNSDSDIDDNKNVNHLSQRRLQQLSPEPGTSGLHKEVEQPGCSYAATENIFDDVSILLESETLNAPRFDNLQSDNYVQVPIVGISSVETPSPYGDRSRKRKANPKSWKKNISKILRNSGKAYTSMSKTKRHVEEKKIGVGLF